MAAVVTSVHSESVDDPTEIEVEKCDAESSGGNTLLPDGMNIHIFTVSVK